jgi:hypothetical protein
VTTHDLSDIKRRASSAFFAVECPPGWHELVCNLNIELAKIDPDYKVVQVKEKYGGLRYYFDTSVGGRNRQLMDIAVARAETQSFTICEQTGGPGVLMRKSGWYKTLDPTIYEKEDWVRING